MEKAFLDDNGDLIVSTDMLMELFNIKGKRIPAEWAKQGCPKLTRGAWKLKDVIEWRGIGRLGDKSEESSASKKLQADADYKHAKARQEETRLMEMLGVLIPKAMLEEQLSEVFTDIRQSLLHLSPSIHTELHRAYPQISAEVAGIVDEQVRKCLQRLTEYDHCGSGSDMATESKRKYKKRST